MTRRVVEGSEADVEAQHSRRFDELKLLVIYIDGLLFGNYPTLSLREYVRRKSFRSEGALRLIFSSNRYIVCIRIKSWVDAHANLPTRARWSAKADAASDRKQPNGECVDPPLWRVLCFLAL